LIALPFLQRDRQKSLCHLLPCLAVPETVQHRFREYSKSLLHRVLIQPLIVDDRKPLEVVWLNSSKKELQSVIVNVHRSHSRLAPARRLPMLTDSHAISSNEQIEPRRRDRVDATSCLKFAPQPALLRLCVCKCLKVRDIRRGSAHVEGDDVCAS